MDKYLLLLCLFSLYRANETTRYFNVATHEFSVEQGDTYSINPQDFHLYDFFRGSLESGASFVNVAPVGSLHSIRRNGTQLSIQNGLVEHIAAHPNQEYVYFFHRNATGSIFNYVELFQVSDILTSTEPKFIRAAEWHLRTHLFPDRSYSYSYRQDQFILLSSTSERKLALMNVTSPAGISEVADMELPQDTSLEHGYFDLYSNYIILPASKNQLVFLRIDMESSPIMSYEAKRLDFYNNAFLTSKGLDVDSLQLTDISVDGGHSLLYVVVSGKGILVLSLATFELNQQASIIHFEALPNVREVETNPHNRRILIATVVPSDSLIGDVVELMTSGSSESDFAMSLRFNMTNVFTAKNTTSLPSHTLYSSPEIATVDARYSLQVASNLPEGMQISTLSYTSDLALALLHTLNNTWMILAQREGSSPNMQDITLYSIEYDRYVIRVDPGSRYIGNFEALVKLDGATCDFENTGYRSTRPTAESYCTLDLALQIEVKGYSLTNRQVIVIAILIVLLAVVGVVVGLIVAKFCAAKRKIKRQKYRRGIPDEIQVNLENDEVVCQGFQFEQNKELFKVDEAPATEEVTPSKQVVFHEVKDEAQKEEEGNAEQIKPFGELPPQLQVQDFGADNVESESPIKPRNLSFTSPASKIEETDPEE